MKWVLSHQSYDHHRWLLRDAEEPAQFTYHLSHHSVRIKAKTARLFFLEETGFLHKKVLLRSEYGVVVGEAQAITAGRMAQLVLDGKKYFYCWKDGQLSLYNKNKTLLLNAAIECRHDTEKMELAAFVFLTAWMQTVTTEVRNAADLLVA